MKRHATLASAVFVLTLVSAQAVQACSMIFPENYNRFSDRGFTPGAQLIGSAQSVDWVVVEAPTGQVCVRNGQIGPGERRFWRFVPRIRWVNRLLAHLSGVSTGGTCNGKPVGGLIGPLRARVVERISGTGPKVYPLWQEVRPDAVEWNVLNDDRVVEDWPGGKAPTAYPQSALTRHGGNAFLDHGYLGVEEEPGSMCGGAPIAHVGHRYLVFRDAKGSILVAERVAFADDSLLVRLRKYAGRPDLFSHPELPARDFFRASDGVAIVRVTRCAKGYIGRKADAVFLSGDPSAQWVGPRPNPKRWGMPDLEWLGMQLERTGQACKSGDQVLILKRPFASENISGSDPRAAVIHDGRVRIRDFMTGFTLTGPAEVSVEQVQAWVAEGRASRSQAAARPAR